MIDQVFEAAKQVDQAFIIILGIAVGILILVTVLMVYFVWRYHHTKNPEPTEIHDNVWLELIWTIVPTILVMAMFWFGWSSYKALHDVPDDAMEIAVEGRMWSWSFTYPNGKRASELVAPVDTPVKLRMTSADVIHSFYVPAMRIKRDTVPGMDTVVWFKSDRTGEFDILCAEYCGLKHANMISKLKVIAQEEYDAWIAGDGEGNGLKLLESYGCISCHSLDGTDGVGPTFKGIAGRQVSLKMPDGTTVTRTTNEAYLKQAIIDPNSEIVEGYPAAMPPYEGAIPDEDLNAMVAYLMTGEAKATPIGRDIAENEGCLSCHSTDGTVIAGPSLRQLYGSVRTGTDSSGTEQERTANEAYLIESIVKPGDFVTQGFSPMMPAYDYLAQDQIDALVEYIKGLAGENK